jgi:hypothetical protein
VVLGAVDHHLCHYATCKLSKPYAGCCRIRAEQEKRRNEASSLMKNMNQRAFFLNPSSAKGLLSLAPPAVQNPIRCIKVALMCPKMICLGNRGVSHRHCGSPIWALRHAAFGIYPRSCMHGRGSSFLEISACISTFPMHQ